MHHLEFNETLGAKTRWELDQEVTYCFEQILEAASYKTAAVRLLTSHLTNSSSKVSKTYWRSKDELISDVLQILIHGQTIVG